MTWPCRRRCTRLHTLTLNCAIFDHDLTLDRLAACTTIEVRSQDCVVWQLFLWESVVVQEGSRCSFMRLAA